MSSIPLPLIDGDTFAIDHSSLAAFCQCPRAAQYSVAQRLRPTTDSVALRFGGIMHKVLEARYRAGEPMYEQTPSVTAAMIAVAEAEYVNWSPPEEDHRTFSCMVSLIEKYGSAYHYEPFQIVPVGGKPSIETPFALPLGTLTYPDGRKIKILWTGRLDMIYDMETGTYIMDHKSSSIATNMAEFEISHQFYGYSWAAEKLLGRPVNGFCINRIVVRRPTRTGEAFTFERKFIPVSRGLLEEWRVDVMHIITDFIEMCRRGYLPKHTAWCVGKYGTCPFLKVCSLDTPEQRDIILSSGDYEPNTWTPLT